jgi:DNA modification methylase
MSDDRPIEITAARGRPMLSWVGKRPLSHVTAFPAQHIETVALYDDADSRDTDRGLWADWPDRYPHGGLLFHGDNKEVLAHLLVSGFRGKVKLIYIDPPFDSGADYVRRVRLRGVAGASQMEGEDYTFGEQIQYEDIWANDNYLQFMYERLMLLEQMLSPEGFIIVHINTARCHYVKMLLDEVFGEANFRNEIIVKRIRKSYTETSGVASLNEGCDYLLMYSSSPETRFSAPLKHDPREERWHAFDAPNIRPNLTYELFGKWPPPGRCWMRNQEDATRMAETGDLRPNDSSGWPEYRLEATEYIVRDTLWDDITASAFTSGYPTEKKEDMLELIIRMATDPGDLVLDCFIGSGTTAAVAQKLGRRWIGCDINKGAIQTTSKRLQSIIQEQSTSQRKNVQKKLMSGKDTASVPAQLFFTVWRVNDYDLQIQHNEAVNLACEHIGILRTYTDTFFDGTLGDALVKIIPFNHPLSPLDLDVLRRELEARPEEDRNITVVCLGKELAADAWIDKWNQLRKGCDAVNRINVIELRTDARYGKLFAHSPASARVRIAREGAQLQVQIDDFVSPTILERLSQQSRVFNVPIDDWRMMVDCVLIDPAYDGEVFSVALSDVPEKRDDLVIGTYSLPAPAGTTTVAVKIIDMLGEEVLVTARV